MWLGEVDLIMSCPERHIKMGFVSKVNIADKAACPKSTVSLPVAVRVFVLFFKSGFVLESTHYDLRCSVVYQA